MVDEDAEFYLSVLSNICRLETKAPLTLSQIPLFNEDIKWGLIDYLLKTNSKYAAFMITDLLGTPDRFNTPATSGPHNWTHKIAYSVEQFYTDPKLTKLQRETRLRIKLLRSAPAIVKER